LKRPLSLASRDIPSAFLRANCPLRPAMASLPRGPRGSSRPLRNAGTDCAEARSLRRRVLHDFRNKRWKTRPQFKISAVNNALSIQSHREWQVCSKQGNAVRLPGHRPFGRIPSAACHRVVSSSDRRAPACRSRRSLSLPRRVAPGICEISSSCSLFRGERSAAKRWRGTPHPWPPCGWACPFSGRDCRPMTRAGAP
jgi:hypothetical protein